MTYAKQLRDYENAVLQKRLEELADDEINALLEEIELEGDATTSTEASKLPIIATSIKEAEETSNP